MRSQNLSCLIAALCVLGGSQAGRAQQITACGSARGMTPYATSSGCVPRLTFHVSGQCLSACREVTRDFTSPDAEARGTCNLAGGFCEPFFLEQNVYDIFTREFSSRAANRDMYCHQGTEVRASSGSCPCAGCSPGATPGNNTTPGEDPLLISIGDTELRLTSFAQGVTFDLNADGDLERTAWTSAGSDDAFLVLDRNFNGTIDSGLEIFGDETPQLPSPEPNGFRALAVFDDPASGGNGDGKIDQEDSIYPWLMLWIDRNHNGKSDSGELQSLGGVISAIELDYRRSLSEDEFGNDLRYWARIERPFGSGGSNSAWNVFFNNLGNTRL